MSFLHNILANYHSARSWWSSVPPRELPIYEGGYVENAEKDDKAGLLADM